MLLIINILAAAAIVIIILMILVKALAGPGIIVTSIRTGDIVLIAAADSIVKVLGNVEQAGWTFDRKTGQAFPIDPVIDGDTGEVIGEHRDTRRWYEKKYGIYWVGNPIFRKVERFHHRWIEYTQEDPTKHKAEYRFNLRDEYVCALQFIAQEGMTFQRIETKDGMRVDVNLLVTRRIVNAILAYAVRHFGAAIHGAVAASIRDYFAARSYDELIEGQNEKGTLVEPGEVESGLVKLVMEINEDTPNGNRSIKTEFGIEIIMINLISIDPAGTDKEKADLVSALTRPFIAEKNLQAAEFRAQEIIKIADAEATAIKKRGEALRESPAVLELERSIVLAKSISDAKPTVLNIGGGMGNIPAMVNIGSTSVPKDPKKPEPTTT